MSKKIIFCVTNDLVFDQRMQRICTTLANNNFHTELVGRILGNSKPVATFPFLQTRLTCFFNKGFLFYAEYNIRLFFYLLFADVDIICGCDLDTLPAAVLAAKLKRKKVVYDAHEYFPESPELIGKPMKQSVWYFIEKVLVKRTDTLYTVTNSIAQIFNRKYKVDCNVIRNLPIKKISHNSQFTTHNYLLYQGAVNIGRGLNEMLLVMLKIENATFYIAGDGDEMEHIKYSIKELNLENKVKLLGKKTTVNSEKQKPNIWFYDVGKNDKTTHNAPFPEQLVNDHIISWSNENDLVYDPFIGSGTTAKMAHLQNRNWIGSEISSEYVDLANKRIAPYLNQLKLF